MTQIRIITAIWKNEEPVELKSQAFHDQENCKMSYTQLTEGQRYQIYGLFKEGLSQKSIAENIGCHPSTISRELKNNRGKRGYRPKQAHSLSMERRQTARKRIKLTLELKETISHLIKQDSLSSYNCNF